MTTKPVTTNPVSTAPFGAIDSMGRMLEAAERASFTPGWTDRESPNLWAEPRSRFAPSSWTYAQGREILDAAGTLIDVRLAERRNMVMVGRTHRDFGNNFATMATIVAAYQMILPGEHPRAHRHAPHALRVVLDAEGAWSVVDGVQTPMETGDIVLTPGGSWHGHGHDGDRPAYLVDVLDVPLVHLIEPMFFEPFPDDQQPITSRAEISPMRFRAADIQAALAAANPLGPGRGRHIVLDTPSMPTLQITVHQLAAGETVADQAQVENRLVVVMAGSGTASVDDLDLAYARGDTFSAPMATSWSITAAEPTTLCFVTDAPVMAALGYRRR